MGIAIMELVLLESIVLIMACKNVKDVTLGST